MITLDELITRLREIKARQDINHEFYRGDCEADHSDADKALLDFIDSDNVREAFDAIEKWYA